MSAVSIVVGIAFIAVALNDVFHTLLRPASTGRLTTIFFRATWSLSRRGRRLTVGGPLTVLATIAMWIILIAVGWALVYLPHIRDGFAHSVDTAQYNPFVESLTYSMVALTTLGLGDVVPTDPVIRAVSPLEALMGFALLSASVSWFLQLYPALARRRSVAIELTGLHESGLAALPSTITPGHATSLITSVAHALAELTADLVQNTEIFYFTERDERLAAARAIGYAMELRNAALSSGDPDVRSAGTLLEKAMDELARVLTDQYPYVSGESTDDVLRAVAESHGHDLTS